MCKPVFRYGELGPEMEGSLHLSSANTRDFNIRMLGSSDRHTVQFRESCSSRGGYGELGVEYGDRITGICLFRHATQRMSQYTILSETE